MYQFTKDKCIEEGTVYKSQVPTTKQTVTLITVPISPSRFEVVVIHSGGANVLGVYQSRDCAIASHNIFARSIIVSGTKATYVDAYTTRPFKIE